MDYIWGAELVVLRARLIARVLDSVSKINQSEQGTREDMTETSICLQCRQVTMKDT